MNVSSPVVRSNQGATNPPRPVSVPMLLLGTVLLAHAAAVVAGQVDLPIWVAVVECLCASLVGLWQLRRMTAAQDQMTDSRKGEGDGPSAGLRSVASPWSGPLSAFPARVGTALDERAEPAARR
jgi:hypothetical protein